MTSSSSLVFASCLFLIALVVSPALAGCGSPATIPTSPSLALTARFRGAVQYPSATSFSSVRWFPFTPTCNVTAATAPPTPTATAVSGYSLKISNFLPSDTNAFFRGVGSEAFQMTSFLNIEPVSIYGDISLKIGNGTQGQNNGNPPVMTNLISTALNPANVNYGLLSSPTVQFKNGVVVGISLQVIYPKLPDQYDQLNSRLALTSYDQYYTLVVEGMTWIIYEYATGNVRASGFFDSVPCENILPGVANPSVCTGIPPFPSVA